MNSVYSRIAATDKICPKSMVSSPWGIDSTEWNSVSDMENALKRIGEPVLTGFPSQAPDSIRGLLLLR